MSIPSCQASTTDFPVHGFTSVGLLGASMWRPWAVAAATNSFVFHLQVVRSRTRWTLARGVFLGLLSILLALAALLARFASNNSRKSGAMQDKDILCIYILYLSPSSVSIGFLLCAGTLVVWWHVVVVGWVRIGVHRGCGLVGFGNSLLTCGVNIQTHMSIMHCVCLCLSMVGHGW